MKKKYGELWGGGYFDTITAGRHLKIWENSNNLIDFQISKKQEKNKASMDVNVIVSEAKQKEPEKLRAPITCHWTPKLRLLSEPPGWRYSSQQPTTYIPLSHALTAKGLDICFGNGGPSIGIIVWIIDLKASFFQAQKTTNECPQTATLEPLHPSLNPTATFPIVTSCRYSSCSSREGGCGGLKFFYNVLELMEIVTPFYPKCNTLRPTRLLGSSYEMLHLLPK